MKLYTLIKLIPLFSLSFLVACSDPEAEQIAKDLTQGELIVNKNCKVCHAQGINGAPIIGNSKMWKDRRVKGQEMLAKNAIAGLGLMPARAGKPELSDNDIFMAVGYMLNQLPSN